MHEYTVYKVGYGDGQKRGKLVKELGVLVQYTGLRFSSPSLAMPCTWAWRCGVSPWTGPSWACTRIILPSLHPAKSEEMSHHFVCKLHPGASLTSGLFPCNSFLSLLFCTSAQLFSSRLAINVIYSFVSLMALGESETKQQQSEKCWLSDRGFSGAGAEACSGVSFWQIRSPGNLEYQWERNSPSKYICCAVWK